MKEPCEKCDTESRPGGNSFSYVDGGNREWIFDVDMANRFARDGRCALVAVGADGDMLDHVRRNGIVEAHVEHVGPYCDRPAVVARVPFGNAFEEVVIDGNHRVAHLIAHGFAEVPVHLLTPEDTLACVMLGPGIPMRGELLRLFLARVFNGGKTA